MATAGFNGIRLPLWPYSDEVKGDFLTAESVSVLKKFTRNDCNELSVTILKVLRNHTLSKPEENNSSYFDDNYNFFKVYWSPAFEGRQY